MNDFLDGEKTVAGLKFRPFTLGSKAACEQMGLSMFLTGETGSENDAERQMVAFTWIHTAPLKTVITALRNSTAAEEAEELGFSITPQMSAEIIREINRISRAAADAAVDVMPKPGAKDDSPGNC
jgi:hypothetical protein